MADGDADAFCQLFDLYRRRIYTYILKITSSPEIAENAIQDIFLKIWQNREKLRHVENFNAYLHRMAQNYAYSGFRSMAKEELTITELKRVALPQAPHPEQILLSKEIRGRIHDLVCQLSPQQRAVFLMNREEGMKYEEIAKQLHISVLTVKKHMSIALRILREELDGRYGFLWVIVLMLMKK
jgi:RNA polymerase sigma-70 factor (family 1)